MLELFLAVLMRLLGVRIFTLASKELLDSLDQADARADTPEKRALIKNLVNDMLSQSTSPAFEARTLPAPAGSPPSAGEGRPSPAPLPKPSPPAAPRRRGRPRKSPLAPPQQQQPDGGRPVHDSQP